MIISKPLIKWVGGKSQIIKQILDDDTKIYVKLYNLIQLSEHLLIRMFYNFTFIQQLSIENIKRIKLLLSQPLSEDTIKRLQQIGRYRKGNLFTLSKEKSYSDFLKKVKKLERLIMQTKNKSILASKSSKKNEKKNKSKRLRKLTRKINVLVSNLSKKKDKIKEDKIKKIEDEIKETEDEIKETEDEIKETEDEETEEAKKKLQESNYETKALTTNDKSKILNMIQEFIKKKLNIKEYYYYNLMTEIKLINHLLDKFESYSIRDMFMDKIKLITRIAKHLETQSSDKNKSTRLLLKNY